MNLLSEITNLIDKLQSSPHDLDINHVIATLSSAHELATQGLHRSSIAARVPELQQNVAALTAQRDTLVADLANVKTDYTELVKLKPVFTDLKSKLIGKLKLCVIDNGATIATELLNESLSVSRYLEIQSLVDAQFNHTWLDKTPHTLKPAHPPQNPNNYTPGGTPCRSRT